VYTRCPTHPHAHRHPRLCPHSRRTDDGGRSDHERWRATLRLPPALCDPTFVNDTIRREHSPPPAPCAH